jgi:hypothetical protein
LDIGGEIDVIGCSRTSRAALATFRRPQIATSAGLGTFCLGARAGNSAQAPGSLLCRFFRSASIYRNKMRIHLAAEGEMSKEPKIEHDYHAGKDKLTITIHRYSLKSKKTRNAILERLMANLESKPDRLIADAKAKSKKEPGKKLRGQQKASKLIVIGD